MSTLYRLVHITSQVYPFLFNSRDDAESRKATMDKPSNWVTRVVLDQQNPFVFRIREHDEYMLINENDKVLPVIYSHASEAIAAARWMNAKKPQGWRCTVII